MLEFAKKYEDQLKKIFYDTAFDLSYMWEWMSTGREWIEPQGKTHESHQFVSTLNGNVLGEIGYWVDWHPKKAQSFYCCHFTKDNGYVFAKDLMECLSNIFDKFHFNKLSYCVIVGNPIESKWDKLTERFGGRVVGIRHQDVMLQDGKVYDVKEYEVLASDYETAKRNLIAQKDVRRLVQRGEL